MNVVKDEKYVLGQQCRWFVSLIRMLPDGMVNEALLEATPFTMRSLERAMDEHAGEEAQMAREALARMELYGLDEGEQNDLKDEEESGVDEDTYQTPSSVNLRLTRNMRQHPTLIWEANRTKISKKYKKSWKR